MSCGEHESFTNYGAPTAPFDVVNPAVSQSDHVREFLGGRCSATHDQRHHFEATLVHALHNGTPTGDQDRVGLVFIHQLRVLVAF